MHGWAKHPGLTLKMVATGWGFLEREIWSLNLGVAAQTQPGLFLQWGCSLGKLRFRLRGGMWGASGGREQRL